MEEKNEGSDVTSIESIEIEPLAEEDLETVSGGVNEVLGVCSAANCSNSTQL